MGRIIGMPRLSNIATTSDVALVVGGGDGATLTDNTFQSFTGNHWMSIISGMAHHGLLRSNRSRQKNPNLRSSKKADYIGCKTVDIY